MTCQTIAPNVLPYLSTLCAPGEIWHPGLFKIQKYSWKLRSCGGQQIVLKNFSSPLYSPLLCELLEVLKFLILCLHFLHLIFTHMLHLEIINKKNS